jgi:oligopeptide/dipeptide ABC transporter ATP-binding protein
MVNLKSGEPVIELSHVSHSYRRGGAVRPALDDVNLSVGSSETVAIVGESGCGKTTLGRVIVGLTRPTEGDVRFRGRLLSGWRRRELAEFRRAVQVVHQNPYGALNPGLTIRETLSAGLKYNRVVSRREVPGEVERLLRIVGLDSSREFQERYPHQLSGGQRQRVVIARAMSLRPQLVVADEPVSMLDVSMRISILDLLKSLGRDSSLAYVFISHDFGVVRYFASGGRIIVMFFGVIVEEGDCEEVIRNPKHPYTFLLLDAVPVPDPRRARVARSLATQKATAKIEAAPSAVGCVFAPRCPFVRPKCRRESPPPRDVGPNREGRHLASCWFVEDVPAPTVMSLSDDVAGVVAKV